MTTPHRTGLIQLLDPNHPLRTPHFQRSYAWTEREIGDYWKDLKAALDASGGPDDYFMGLVVFDKGRQIQDGQQRLATTLIFVQELWRFANDIHNASNQQEADVWNEIAAVVAPLNANTKPVLAISDADQAALMNKLGVAATLPESTRRLNDARTHLRTYLEEDVGARRSTKAKLTRLLGWARFVETGAYVVELEVAPRVAHKIFETLNTRGVRLSSGDLVKSYLLARASDHKAAQHLWEQIIKALSDADGDYEDNVDDFLYHYYGSRYDKVVAKEPLFAAFSQRVDSLDPLDVLDELLGSAQLYAGLIYPFTAPALKQHPAAAKYAIQFMNGMRFRQLRYLLLAVLRDYTGGATKAADRRAHQGELIQQIAAWAIRSLVTGRVGGQVAQSLYVAAAKAIREGKATSVTHVRKLFLDKQLFVESKRAFEREFLSWRFDTRQGRALLFELERAELGANAALTLKGTLTLEHVLPRRPKAGTWTKFRGDDRRIYPHRIGNYLLLAQPFNSSLGNLEWPPKRARITAVKASQTPLTVAALSHSDWTQKTIDDRSKMLAKKASSHWPS